MLNPGHGVSKSQFGGVQGQSRRLALVRLRRCPIGSPVFHIPTQWMADFRQLDADLIGSAGFQPTFKFRIIPSNFQRLNVGDHVPPGLVFAAAATQAIATVPDLIGPKRSGFQMTRHDAEVTSKCLVRCKLGDQPLLCLGRAGKDQNPAGLTVNPVHREEFRKVRRGGAAFAFFNQSLQGFFKGWLPLATLRSPVLIPGMSHGQHA